MGKRSNKSKAKNIGKGLPSLAAERYKAIAPLVNFEFTGTAHNKKKIKAYWDELEPLLAQPNVIYKTRSKANLKTAIKTAGFERRLPGIKAVPIPTNGVENVKVKVTRGKLVLASKYLEQEIIPLNQRRLATDAEDYLNEITREEIDELESEYPGEARYLISAGKHHIDKSRSAKQLPAQITRLMMQYDKGTKGSEKHGNSTWRDWMHSVRKLKPKNQKSLDEFMRDGVKARKTTRKTYRKKTRKARK